MQFLLFATHWRAAPLGSCPDLPQAQGELPAALLSWHFAYLGSPQVSPCFAIYEVFLDHPAPFVWGNTLLLAWTGLGSVSIAPQVQVPGKLQTSLDDRSAWQQGVAHYMAQAWRVQGLHGTWLQALFCRCRSAGGAGVVFPGAKSHQLPAITIVGVSLSQPKKHRLCLLPATRLAWESPFRSLDGQERFPGFLLPVANKEDVTWLPAALGTCGRQHRHVDSGSGSELGTGAIVRLSVTVRPAPSYWTLSWVRRLFFFFPHPPYALVQKPEQLGGDFVGADGV